MGPNKLGRPPIVCGFTSTSSRFEKPYKKVFQLTKYKGVFPVLINLLTLNRKKDFDSTHADSFNTVYFTIFHLLLAWMLLTGLQLYVHGWRVERVVLGLGGLGCYM